MFLSFFPKSCARSTFLGLITFSHVIWASDEQPKYSHNFSYERSQYEEEYLIDDLTLTFRPISNSAGYELSIWPNWSAGFGLYKSFGEISDTLSPGPNSQNDQNSRVEAEHRIASQNLYLYRYFEAWWASISYIQGQDEQIITFRSPNKVFQLEDDSRYQTYSLGAGKSIYTGQWVVGLHGYLDYQQSESDYRYVLGEGTVLNRVVSDTNTDENSVGFVGTIGINGGYDFYLNNFTISPNLAWSHTRTLDGEVNQFQQSQNRFVTTDRTTSIGEESESVRDSEANPISIWTLSTSVMWGNWWLRGSRQHTAGAPANEDVYGIAVGWRFEH